MLHCDTCDSYTEHEFRDRPDSGGIKDAFCVVCENKTHIIVPRRTGGEPFVIDANSGVVHC